MEILGDEAGNMALMVLATGGVYLGGGIPPRILPQLQKGPFLKFFSDKGRFSEIMERIPVTRDLQSQGGVCTALPMTPCC